MLHTFNFIAHFDDYVFDDRFAYLSDGGCRLRRHDSANNYSPVGTFTETEVELPNISGTAIREFTGVAVAGTVPDGTSVGYQISIDDGTIWQWYNGTVWQIAGVNDWSTLTQLDAGVPLIDGRQLKIKFRLTPDTDATLTPHLYVVHVFFEAVWGYFEDLKRSIKTLIDNSISTPLVDAQELASTSSTIAFTSDNRWEILGVSAVYDTTGDPGRLTNLYASYDAGTRVVTLTGSVASGNIVETHYIGKCNVFLAADEDLQISEVPAIVVVLPRAVEDKYAPKNLFTYEPLVGKGVVRRREPLIPISSTIMIYAVSATEVGGLALQDALAEIFEPEPVFRSVAVGEDFFCLTYEPLIDNDMVSTGLHVKATQLMVLGNKDLRAFTDLQPVTTIEGLYVGAAQVGEPGDPSNLAATLTSPDALVNPICETIPPETEEISE